MNVEAYKCKYLLANSVLGKNPFGNTFYDNYTNKSHIIIPELREIIRFLKIYYKNTFREYIKYIKRKIIWMKYGHRFNDKLGSDKLIIIDTYFLTNKIIENKIFFDTYFDQLIKTLEKKKINYAYLPIFFGINSDDDFKQTLKILKNHQVSMLSEFELLTTIDFLRLICLVLIYPYHVLRLFYSLKDNSFISQVFKNELLISLPKLTISPFSRYLQGIRISALPFNDIKIISWYENQVIQKTFYKGLRKKKFKIDIYGCQLFIWPFSILNIICDPNEIDHGIVPDKVLVNGKYYLYTDKRINSDVGPSLRYNEIFNFKVDFNKRKDFLVLLPYFDYEIVNLLTIIKNLVFSPGRIIIKFHPTTIINRFNDLIPTNAIVSEMNIYELFVNTKIVLSSQSGGIVEAVSVGIPAIVLPHAEKYSHNPLPHFGKSIVWDYARDQNDVEELIEKFNFKLDHYNNEIIKISDIYKEMFFCEPTEKKVLESFEL